MLPKKFCAISAAMSDYRIHNVGGGGVVFRNNNASVTVRVVVNGILTRK